MRAFYFPIILITFTVSHTFAAEKPADEEIVRQRFLAAYTAAQTPEARSQAVVILKGAQDKESQRLLAGMLGDKNDVVRKTACEVIAQTPDKQGYFVKPLTGPLLSGSNDVRAAAAEALSHAAVKADAIRALTYELLSVSNAKEQTEETARLVQAYDVALCHLANQSSKKKSARELSDYWLGYWKENEETLRAEDDKKLSVVPPPSREGMAPDSFDLKDPKKDSASKQP